MEDGDKRYVRPWGVKISSDGTRWIFESTLVTEHQPHHDKDFIRIYRRGPTLTASKNGLDELPSICQTRIPYDPADSIRIFDDEEEKDISTRKWVETKTLGQKVKQLILRR